MSRLLGVKHTGNHGDMCNYGQYEMNLGEYFCILLFWNGFTSNYVGLGIELKETLAAKLGDLRISHLLAVFGPFAGSTKKLVSCWGLGCTAVLNTAYAGESRVYIYIYRCFLFQFRIT